MPQVLDRSNETFTLDCGAGQSFSIEGNKSTITLTGSCGTVEITGNGHRVRVSSVQTLDVSGNDNRATAGEAGSIDVSGNGNAVTWVSGLATVYRATDLALDRLVAVKVLGGPARRDPAAARRFFHEGRLAARLDHPAIVAIYDVGEDDRLLYLAMRLVDGPSLAAAPAPPATIQEDLAVLHRIGDALDHAHQREVVHRDVKPSNILLEGGQASRACLVDFGIATTVRTSGLYTTGAIGTAAYMAPEQATPGSAGPAADRYSLACVAYELLCGRRPFPGEDHVALLVRHATEPVPLTGSTSLDQVFATGLAKDPRSRPATCAELVAALERAVLRAPGPIIAAAVTDAHDGQALGSTPANVRWPGPRRWRGVVVATALVLVAVAVAWWWAGRDGNRGRTVTDAAGISYQLPSSAWRVGETVPGRTTLTRDGQPAAVVTNSPPSSDAASGPLGCSGPQVTRSLAGRRAVLCPGGSASDGQGTVVAVVVGSTAWRFEVAGSEPTAEENRFLDSVRFG